MISRQFCLGVGLLCLSIFSAVAQADRLVMKNGSVIIGELVSADEAKVIFSTPFAGNIAIRQENIKTVVTEKRVDVLLKDGSLFRGKQIVAQDESLIALGEDEDPVVFDVLDIRMVNPEPWRLGLGYRWTGRADAAFESTRGNTDLDQLDLNMESIWRGLRDRYTARGVWEEDETNGDRNKYSWLLRGKYDRFSEENRDNYAGFQASAEHDEFQDLDLRTTLGPYLGRQFIDTSVMQLYGELGVVSVEEDFDVADDNDFWGLNWEARWASEPLAGYQLYANQDGVLDVNDPGDTIMNTILGIRFPTLFGFATAAEAVYEYDGGAVAGVSQTDETFRVKVGYSW